MIYLVRIRKMSEYILVDASYFIFFRVFALHIWWKNAKPDETLGNPIENEEFVEKFKSTFESKLYELKKKLKKKDAIFIIGKDCPRKHIWRTNLYPEYKQGRNDEKNVEANIGSFFKLVEEEKLFEKAKVDHIVKLDKLEADDCLALTCKYLKEQDKDNNITIITSDHDYIQLLKEYPTIKIINCKFKSLTDSKSYSGNPDMHLFYKIVMGDKSDNITPIFKKCGIKTAEKYYLDHNSFHEKLVYENKVEKYLLNKKLIDFNEIPNDLTDLFYKHIISVL